MAIDPGKASFRMSLAARSVGPLDDKKGVRWAMDRNGVLHRFSKPSNGETHWNGSTAGKDPIPMHEIPGKVKKLFGIRG